MVMCSLSDASKLARTGRWDEVMSLIQTRPELAVREFDDGETLLSAMSYFGEPRVVQLLIAAGADVNHQDKSGETPLLACLEGAYEGKDTKAAMSILLEADANPNQFAYMGQTALHWAVAYRLPDYVEILISSGADPYLKSADLEPENAFEIASRSMCSSLIAVLQRHEKRG